MHVTASLILFFSTQINSKYLCFPDEDNNLPGDKVLISYLTEPVSPFKPTAVEAVDVESGKTIKTIKYSQSAVIYSHHVRSPSRFYGYPIMVITVCNHDNYLFCLTTISADFKLRACILPRATEKYHYNVILIVQLGMIALKDYTTDQTWNPVLILRPNDKQNDMKQCRIINLTSLPPLQSKCFHKLILGNKYYCQLIFNETTWPLKHFSFIVECVSIYGRYSYNRNYSFITKLHPSDNPPPTSNISECFFAVFSELIYQFIRIDNWTTIYTYDLRINSTQSPDEIDLILNNDYYTFNQLHPISPISSLQIMKPWNNSLGLIYKSTVGFEMCPNYRPESDKLPTDVMLLRSFTNQFKCIAFGPPRPHRFPIMILPKCRKPNIVTGKTLEVAGIIFVSTVAVILVIILFVVGWRLCRRFSNHYLN